MPAGCSPPWSRWRLCACRCAGRGGKHCKGGGRRRSASACPDEGHDAHQLGGIVDQELHEPEIAELGHPPGWVAGPQIPAEQAVVRVFTDAGQYLHQKVEPLAGRPLIWRSTCSPSQGR